MRVESKLEITAPPALVWEYVSDPSRYLDFMSGITRWEVVGAKRIGLGARYRMLLRVGSAEVGGLIEVVEFARARRPRVDVDHRHRPARALAACGRATRAARTVTTLRLSYGVAGSGIWGWLADKVAAPTVRGHLRRSLQQLKRQVEHEQLRSAAAERRRSRMGAA